MNNRHLLRIRLASIEHYREEIKKLNEALETTQKTKEELIQGLTEFVTFASGAILIYKSQVFRFLGVKAVTEDWRTKKIIFVFKVNFPSRHGGYENTEDTQNVYLSELEGISEYLEPIKPAANATE